MLCESCKKNNATVSLTEIKDSKATVYQLCENCARSQGYPAKQTLLGDLISGFVTKTRSSEGGSEKACEICGMTYQSFRAKGRLGCPQCYDLFEEELTPLLEKIHGSARHIGKVPRESAPAESETLRLRNRLAQLKRELKSVVESEDYERAVEIRDRIQTMEKELAREDPCSGSGPEGA
ncbi:MAG: UvrB/UvrC motif-containing protein [Planctomycetota bacterium]